MDATQSMANGATRRARLSLLPPPRAARRVLCAHLTSRPTSLPPQGIVHRYKLCDPGVGVSALCLVVATPSPGRGGGSKRRSIEVRLFYTVTFCANPTHNLTRSP